MFIGHFSHHAAFFVAGQTFVKKDSEKKKNLLCSNDCANISVYASHLNIMGGGVKMVVWEKVEFASPHN